MPVKISDGPVDPHTMAITLDEYQAGRQNFALHYEKNGEGPLLGQDFAINWDDLAQAVESYCDDFSVPTLEVAMRFVHNFDEETSSLCLRLQICSMSETTMYSYERPMYQLETANSRWYDIKEDSFTVSSSIDLVSDDYLNALVYKPVPTADETEVLSSQPGKFVCCLTFPWQAEILAMYMENGQPDNAKIHFASCSYFTNQGNAAVIWPHGLVLYMENSEGHHMMDNNSSIVIFHYKGADMATACPPQCGSYIMAPTAAH